MGLFANRNEVTVPLRGVGVEIELSGMFAHTRIAQRYRNESDETIEVIYAFPVPTEGLLLGMEIDISGKKLNGIVQAKNQARNTYENAVVAGNGAFLLQQLGDGLYQMNIGNLKPGEEAEIRIRYGELLRWRGNTLRYRLPTVVAPHYGDPGSAGISREDAPKAALLAEYPLTLEMTIKGDLARGEMDSPSHAVEVERGPSSTHVCLGKNANLDRDFILTISMSAPPAWEVLTAPDGERVAALGCLNVPALGGPAKRKARDITIVVDCSGSMNGDSIAQARSALIAILDELRDGDTVAILRFGSSIDIWTPEPVTLDERQREWLRGKICALEADLGGTEIMQAISKAIAISKAGADILLITDGEAHVDKAELVKAASMSRRFFTVGVGTAVSEIIVKTLADVSGGACELVTPNEHMGDRIVAHTRRMSMPRARLDVDWRAIESARLGRKGVVFAGDTLPIMAILDRQPSVKPSVTLDAGNNRFIFEADNQAAEGSLADALPRIVAWHRINSVESAEEATDIAVRYQIVTKHTAMVAVLERAETEKTDGLPTLADVPQMLAAGWGGMGTPRRYYAIAQSAEAFDPNSQISFSRHFGSLDALTARNLFAPTMYHLLGALQDWGMYERIGDFILLLEDPGRFKKIAMIELPIEVHDWLEALANSRQDMVIEVARKIVILAFLACLLDLVAADKQKPEMQKYFRAIRRAVKKEIQLNPVPKGLRIQIADWLKTTTMREWCFPGGSVS